MEKFLKKIRGVKIFKRLLFILRGRVITLKPNLDSKGRVLLSYTTLPFLSKDAVLNAHSNRWECKEIARIFNSRGYVIDIIDWDDMRFKTKKTYDIILDIHGNLEKLSKNLNNKGIKIFHITASHWLFQNTAEYKRLLDLKERRGVVLKPRRLMSPSLNIENADVVTLLGNKSTGQTYAYANKKIIHVPISTTHSFPSPKDKDFSFAKNSFIWFGGVGAVHKGLDLVLEAFSETPHLNLKIIGKVKNEVDFISAYKKELFNLSNIELLGWMDPGSEEFKKITDSSVALIYPSSSEGQSGAVVLTMHAGLIPIISRESGVDVEDFGIILKENTIAEIKKQIEYVSNLPEEKLKEMAINSWKYAREQHTREKFSEEFNKFVDYLEENERPVR